MSADDHGSNPRKSRAVDSEARVVVGPWETTAKTKPAREPMLKRREPMFKRSGRREPWINSWKGLAICLFLLFVAPPLAGWAGRIIMHTLFGAQ